MKIISLVFTFLLFVSLVFSIDPVIIKYTVSEENSYSTTKCTPRFNILVKYNETLVNDYSFTANAFNGDSAPSAINGSLYLFRVSASVNIGKNQPVSFQIKDSSASTYPGLAWDFINYATFDCNPTVPNITMKSKQTSFVNIRGQWGTIFWMQMVEVQGIQNRSTPYEYFTCRVPQPFYCSFTEFLNGVQVKNFLIQVAIYKSQVQYTPFNVTITDKQGKVLLDLPFDGLPAPTTPPASITSIESYPANNATIIKGEMLNNAVYIMNILNMNSMCSVASSNDYFLQNSLIPLYGTPDNAYYIGFTAFQGSSPLTSYVQVLDKQGSKRVSADRTIYFKEKKYEDVVVDQKVSYIDNSNVLNFKAIVSYNPNTNLFVFGNTFDERVYLNYPFGYSAGTSQNHSVSIDFQYSNYIRTPWIPYISISASDSNIQLSFTNNITDLSPSLIQKVETVQISFNSFITRVHAKDLNSGVLFLQYSNLLKVTASDIVYGNQFDGWYELVETFDIMFGPTTPSVQVIDNAGNVATAYAIYNTNFDSLPEIPLYKFATESDVDPYTITGFEFLKNDIDVSNGPVNNTLCMNYKGSNKNVVPRFFSITHPLNVEYTQNLNNAIPGKWNDVKGMFCMDFTIPGRLFTGDFLYGLIIPPFSYDVYYLSSAIGAKAQLRVTSSFGDQMPPIVTEFAAYPSNNVVISQNTNIGWDIKIEDSPNGMVSAEFNITSDYDLQPYTIKLTPSNAISGTANAGKYQLRVPISASTCRAQSFRISSASITDTQGHTSILPSNQNLNPLIRFLNSPQLVLNITCPSAISDSTPPVLTSFASSVNTIDVGTYKDFRNITFTIKTSDVGSGISSRHNPVVYLTSKSFNQISRVSSLVSNANGISTYTTTVQLPYGYGAYQDILVSVYGIVDNQLNINGYSSTDLKSLGFQSTIKVTYSNTPVLDLTSAINSTGTKLTIYGHKFGIDQSKLTLQIDYNKGQGWVNTPVSFFSGIILMTQSIQPTSTPFYVRVIVDGQTSNSLLVIPSIENPNPQCSTYEVTQKIVSSWVNSELYDYSLISITIRNTGSKPIKLFSFVMDNIDQIWGVDVKGNRYTLPSYHEVINPFESYDFGYIIKSKNVGILNDIQFTCL